VPISPNDEIRLTIQCFEQAGGLNGASVPYAAAISLEVAEALGVEVYAESLPRSGHRACHGSTVVMEPDDRAPVDRVLLSRVVTAVIR